MATSLTLAPAPAASSTRRNPRRSGGGDRYGEVRRAVDVGQRAAPIGGALPGDEGIDAVDRRAVVAAQQNILAGLRGETRAETTGEDNLNPLRLVYACYESIASGKVVRV